MAEPFEYEQKSSPAVKVGLALGVVALISVGVVLIQQMNSSSGKTPRRAEPPVVMIKPLPPPPPPPPPPQNVPQRQEEQQTTVSEQDMKPAEQAPDDPSPSLATGVTGSGPADGFGLGGKDKGRIGGTGAGGGGGSRYGGYFTQVVQSINEALSRHAATRNASFDVPVRIWTDATGRVTKVRLMRSTGSAELDGALRNQVFASCQLPDIPSGMRMPLEIRAVARRPN